MSVASGSQRSFRSEEGMLFLPRLASWVREALFWGGEEHRGVSKGVGRKRRGQFGVGEGRGEEREKVRLGCGSGSR